MRFTIFWRGMIIALSLTSLQAYGQETTETPTLSLTIEQAVETALRKNASLGREEIELAAKKRQSESAVAGLLPTIGVSANLTRNNLGVVDTSGRMPWANNNAAGISINLDLSKWVDIETARLNYQTGTNSLDITRRATEKSVRAAFYGLLLLQGTLFLEEQSLERIENQLRQAEASQKAGLISDLEVMTVQISLLTAQSAVETQRTNLAKQTGLFCQLLGLPADLKITLVGDLGTNLLFNLPNSLPTGDGSAELLALKASLSGTERVLTIQRWNRWLPSLSLSWNWAPSSSDLTSPSPSWADSTGGLSIGMNFSLNNLLPWNTAAEAAAQSSDQVRKLQSLIAELSETQKLRQHNNLLQIQQSVRAIALSKKAAELAELAYELASEAYRKGLKDWLSVQNIEGEMQKAGFGVVHESYNFMLAVLDYEHDENLPFGTVMGGLR